MHVYPNQTNLGSTGCQSKHQNIMAGRLNITIFLRLAVRNKNTSSCPASATKTLYLSHFQVVVLEEEEEEEGGEEEGEEEEVAESAQE